MEFVPNDRTFLPLMDSFRLSPRTASYIDALIREGDKFDYSKWLQRVREEEAPVEAGSRNVYFQGCRRSGNRQSNWYIRWYLAEPEADDQSCASSKSASANTSCTQKQSIKNQPSAAP